MSWLKTMKKKQDTAKFVPHEMKVTVDVSFAPAVTTVEGRFGKRQMNIIKTVEYGLVYVTDVQFLRIVESLRAANGADPEDKWQNTTVML